MANEHKSTLHSPSPPFPGHSTSSRTTVSAPPPSPARFITHKVNSISSNSSSYSSLRPSSSTTLTNSSMTLTINRNDIMTADITDVVTDERALRSGDTDAKLHALLSENTDTIHGDHEIQYLLKGTREYPPDYPSNGLDYSTSILSNRRMAAGTHTPVAAVQVFARNAPPLYLPKLDAHISTLPKPSFMSDKASSKEPHMFPPMDRLVATGQTLEDLELNSQAAPFWSNRKTLLGSAANLIMGITGSSALATFYSLQGVANTVQVFALILSTLVPLKGEDLGSEWRKLLLGTIPNVLALNFASTLTQSLIFLVISMVIASTLMYNFIKSSRHCGRYNRLEGLQQTEPESKRWGLVVVTFLLTVIYLPMSTMAVHVLVWSQDLWVVDNPYINATSFPPVLPPLGPASEYREPLDFCWTTTMKREEINYAPVVVIISALVFLALTVAFPLILHRVIKKSVPKIDPYTELGRPRNKIDMDAEYHRRLDRDINPFAFLYTGFRREWGTYESTYLIAKLSTLLIVAVIDPDNCLFRSASRSTIPIVRQVLLLVATIGFFLAQCTLAPFLDPVNNASEWTSRLNYVLTSIVALLVALNVPGRDILNTYVLYTIYVVTYGLSLYFLVINWGITRRLVKRLARRIDFSIDIFSPRLAVSYPSLHAKRRIWQESISALLLTNTDCKIPAKQHMTFAQARDSKFPPYLLNFAGSPGERHVENLKILREIGSSEYRRAAALVSGPDFERYRWLEDEIQRHFIGPDSYWKNPSDSSIPGCTNFFGNAWYIPFPPTLVMHYDDGRFAVLTSPHDLETYVSQNSSRDIQRRREVRMSLRALEGQTVRWPYERIIPVGSQSLCCCFGRRYNANATVHYETAILKIKRRGYLSWQNVQLGSGFDIELVYAKNVVLNSDTIGLSDDFELSPPLAHFFALNQNIIFARFGKIEAVLSSYRHHHWKECRHKANVLSYRFLSHVYDRPRDPTGLAVSSIEFERDLRVRQLMAGSEAVFEAAYDRFATVSLSETATWWYIFWDDLWRRNHDTISALQLHATDFNPYYPSSIAYTPIPRPALEAFLIQRGLLSTPPKWKDFFHSGFLNKLYLRLNETVFRGSSKAILFHLGDDISELDMEGVDFELQYEGQPSTLGTGGGTDHDDASIRPRPEYRWEGALSDPLRPGRKRKRKFLAKMGAWMGVTPLWRAGLTSQGLSVDVRLENGRYTLLEETRPK